MSEEPQYGKKYRATDKRGRSPVLSQDEYGFDPDYDISDRFANDYLGYCEFFNKYESNLTERKFRLKEATHFLKNARESSIVDVGIPDLEIYIQYCIEERKNREGTIVNKLNSVANLIDHIHTNCNPETRPALIRSQIQDIDLSTRDGIRPEIERIPLTRDEVLLLIEHAGNQYPQRDKLIIRVLYETGLRNADLRELKIEDVDLEKNIITVKNSKGDVPGETSYKVPIRHKLARLLDQWITVGRDAFLGDSDCKYLFSTHHGEKFGGAGIRYIVKSAADDAEIQEVLAQVQSGEKEQSFHKVTPHALRHSITTHLDNENLDDDHLKLILGNESTLDDYRGNDEKSEEFDCIRGTLHSL